MKKKDERIYNAWSSYLENTRDRANYAVRRMDLLVISICGAGTYIIFETFRAVISGSLISNNTIYIKMGGVFFLSAVVTNFISQLTGFYANDYEEKYIYQELTKIEGKEIDECYQKKVDKLSKRFTLATNILNISSITLMLVGLLLLAIFNYSLF